jgi:hypothetical protein
MTLACDDGGYHDLQFFTIMVNPTFATHDINKVKVTLVNNGRIGFSDLTPTQGGVGFEYNGANQLFEGGLIVGTSSTKLVDVIRNLTCSECQDNDFASQGLYLMTTPGVVSNQDGEALFLDSTAVPTSSKIGIEVHMYSYAFVSPADSDYVLLRYDVTNVSGAQITGLHFGLFFDWDALPNYDRNKCNFDASRNLGYAWDTSTTSPVYVGASAMEGTIGFTALSNAVTIDLSKAGKWSWISNGVSTTTSVGDIHFVISSGLDTIPANETRILAFAIAGSNSLPQLQAAADAAAAKWQAIKLTVDVREKNPVIPNEFALYQNYPNPFNPTTIIKFDVPEAGDVSLKVFDVLGREVAQLADGVQQAGLHSVTFDGSGLSAGVYYYRLTAGERSSVRKLLLVK